MVSRFPEPIRSIALKHRELVKFALVGGTCFVIDTALFFGIKILILPNNPVTAKIIATLIATIVSYILNREWSFRTRGGRERHHEAALFFLVNGVGIVLNSAPLWVSRYLFHLQEPHVSRVTEELADFLSAQIVGTLIGMAFRWYGYKKWVFPDENGRRKRPLDEEEALGHS
ncbi:Putative flippase GtrA (transmembrane translocase of bactoprenol-linked glucose) [Lentzea xinjiangensis]|uniref:Putative flippase GtrA (Transmembrane translocase of bactoprenol-linked glucose) n=1 Tax=Lentzea xinjiangensis TaxID=402600 RepID=A0A1H9C1Z3_9PSEU|nr:Putative flippase GtrA (transmembrane translocase of bactoprenol-linked glucose) [Lentzea xinjiangensis]